MKLYNYLIVFFCVQEIKKVVNVKKEISDQIYRSNHRDFHKCKHGSTK